MTWHISREEGAAATCDHDGCEARILLGDNNGIPLADRAANDDWVVHWPQAARHSCPTHVKQPPGEAVAPREKDGNQ